MELPRGRLLAVSDELDGAELAALKFLCRDHVPWRRLEAVRTPHDLFEALQEKGELEPGNLAFLRELLYHIGRIDLLVAHLGSSREQVERELRAPGAARVPRFRYLLFQLYEDVTEDELMSFKLLLVNELPKSKLTHETLLEAYKMTSRPCGVCLILNNHNFAKAREGVLEHKHMKDRNGTDVDAAALRNVFSKLHFRVEEYRDLTADEIRETVNIFQSADHEDKDCFVCCILSHGKKGIIYGVDGQEVPIRELTTSFTAENCNSLAGKPKVFFIQACQGDAFHKGVTIETDSGEQDSSVEQDARLQLDCIPAEADFLLGMATLQDYVSYRSPREGTWYIQALCQHLEYSCPRGEDVLTILTAVNEEVSRKTCERDAKKQMPQPSFTLRKRLIFPVN
ncbi:caspase-8-like isoform X2 [Passer montanus]|uniref:caspase-8-like isoform X2 n=1 Tax=Passer montanus TaxID=9160 RepID=UPI0019601614|nr:caspase-8-like isoform X2 [Passer montanus]